MKQLSYCYSALSFIGLLIACSPVKQYSIYEEIDLKEAAINLAIEDFSKKCWLFKKDSVFSVDSIQKMFNIVQRTSPATYTINFPISVFQQEIT